MPFYFAISIVYHEYMKRVFHVSAVVIILAIGMRIFIVDSFIVQGDSMSPAIQSGDYVFINKMSYRFHEPMRGDIIVAKPRSAQGHQIIKRVIALPSEIIEISSTTIRVKNDRIDEGEALSEPYLALPTNPSVGINKINVDPYEYFVLGDNRYASIDSRELGSINKWDIKGVVFFVFRFKDFSFKLF